MKAPSALEFSTRLSGIIGSRHCVNLAQTAFHQAGSLPEGRSRRQPSRSGDRPTLHVVIHVATVHHKSDKWIDVQLDYLRRNIHEPYRVVANLEDVSGNHATKFDRVVPAIGRHSGKLNLLAAEIVAEADPDDLIFFLDGDAFPVVDPVPTVRAALEDTVLVAVRRDENGEDRQPHPSFCAIRVRDWDDIRGDWSMGHSWPTAWGAQVSDSGGNLLRILERRGLPWTPLLRTNRSNPHSLWFAIYGGIIYHHGAGFRKPLARGIGASGPNRWIQGEQAPVVGPVIRKVGSFRIKHWQDREMAASRQLGDEIFDSLSKDPGFYRRFI